MRDRDLRSAQEGRRGRTPAKQRIDFSRWEEQSAAKSRGGYDIVVNSPEKEEQRPSKLNLREIDESCLDEGDM